MYYKINLFIWKFPRLFVSLQCQNIRFDYPGRIPRGQDYIDSMQVALERVVSQGLGRKAGTPFLQVAGKTGTAQLDEYDYYNEAGTPLSGYHLSFCGYFPANAPKYSMIVSLNKMGLPASGGGMAGALFHDIVEWMIFHDMLPLVSQEKE